MAICGTYHVASRTHVFQLTFSSPTRFLYQGREVSYSSVLNQSVSARRQTLYKARGLDIERWHDLVAEARALKKEIGGIARDYGEEWQNREEDREDGNELHVTPRGRRGGSGGGWFGRRAFRGADA